MRLKKGQILRELQKSFKLYLSWMHAHPCISITTNKIHREITLTSDINCVISSTLLRKFLSSFNHKKRSLSPLFEYKALICKPSGHQLSLQQRGSNRQKLAISDINDWCKLSLNITDLNPVLKQPRKPGSLVLKKQ